MRDASRLADLTLSSEPLVQPGFPRSCAAALAILFWGATLFAQRSAARASVAIVPFRHLDASVNGNVERTRGEILQTGMSAEGLLASALLATGHYTLVDESTAAGVFRDDSIATGQCFSVLCALPAGRTLGADRVITGTVSRFSRIIWFISLTMVDVQSRSVLHHEEIEVKGDVADILPKAMIALARRFLAHDPMAQMGAAEPTSQENAGRISRDSVMRMLARSTEANPAVLSGSDLSGLDLSGLDFKQAKMVNARLVGTNFSRAGMFGVTLSGADATGANFSGAVLDVAVLREARLERAILRDASLYATILIGANLSDADLTNARVIAAMMYAKLRGAKLVNARLGADPGNQPMGLMRTDLSGADLTGADLTGSDLRKVKFTRADLTGATLRDADLSGADLGDAILRSIHGRDSIRGLDLARNIETAVFDKP